MPRLVLLVFALLLLPRMAPAQSAQDQARALSGQAVELGRAGRFSEALALFERAYSLAPSPVLLYNLGRTADKAGDRVKARAALEQFLKEVKDAEGRARGEKALAEVLARWPAYLRVTSPTAGAWVEVDGKRRGKMPLAALEVAPGRHVVKVAAPGKRPFEKTVEMKADDSLEVVALLEALPPPSVASPEGGPKSVTGPKPAVGALLAAPGPSPAPATTPIAPGPAVTEQGSGSSRSTLGWVCTGAGAAALGVGGYFLWRMSDLGSQMNRANDQYVAAPTPENWAEVAGKHGDARTAGIVGYSVGAAGLALAGFGVYQLLTGPSEGAVSVVPLVSPQGAGLSVQGVW